VIIADTRSSMVAAGSAAAVGCVFSGAPRRIYGVDATPSDIVKAQSLTGLILALSACRYWKG
jgi:hypothetical protein